MSIHSSVASARHLDPQAAIALIMGAVEGDTADGVSRSNQAREGMEAALSSGGGMEILKQIGQMLMPLLDMLVPGLGSLLGGLLGGKGGGGKK